MSAPSLDALRAAIDGDRHALCKALKLRPDGKRFFCPACQSDGAKHADGDFSIEAGFRCHKCGLKGDGLALVQTVKGCDFPAAVEFARGVYGIRDAEGASVTKAPAPERKGAKVHASLDDAAKAVAWGVEKATIFKHNETRRDIYRDAEGRDVAAVLRFDRADGAKDESGKPIKTFRPVHAVDAGWKTGDPPGKWPPFNLPEILASAGPLFIVEGEKAACAGVAIGLTCSTSAHGAKSPSKTDWQPLAGRDVVILPDHDRSGRGYGEAVAGLAHAAGVASIRIVDLPGLPTKGDLCDFVALRSGQTPDVIRAEIERLAASADVWTPPTREAPPELPAAPVDNATMPDPVQAARTGTPYAMTDLGNAERLCAWFRDAIRWDVARRVWRVWDGRRWAVDSALKIFAMAADTARRIRKEAAAAPSGNGDGCDLGRDLFAHAVKSESRDRLAAMLEVAKSRPGVAIAADTMDADPWLLNVLNGTIDLRTGTLRPHNRADLITKLAPVEYCPGCRDPRFDKFIADATGGDAALAAFIQVVSGYTLTGDTSEEKLFLVYGPEAGGKSTFLDALRAVLGEYARTIQADLLTRQRESRGGGAASPELAGLAGARLAAGSELEQGRELAEALLKNLTGGENITARFLYADLFDFAPQFKIWLALNHCPKASADDGAIWRRILRIGFEHTVPPERRDKTLKPYLRDPTGGAPAVLAWAVAGCLRWQREGLLIPDAVAQSTAAYRQESDPLALFIEDCLQFNAAAWTPWADIWQAYCEHATEAGTAERYRIAPKRLQERLRARDCQSERRYTGRGWAGVELQTGWQSGNHDGHVAYDATSQTFSTRDKLEKVTDKASLPSCPTCAPTPDAVNRQLDLAAAVPAPAWEPDLDGGREYEP